MITRTIVLVVWFLGMFLGFTNIIMGIFFGALSLLYLCSIWVILKDGADSILVMMLILALLLTGSAAVVYYGIARDVIVAIISYGLPIEFLSYLWKEK